MIRSVTTEMILQHKLLFFLNQNLKAINPQQNLFFLSLSKITYYYFIHVTLLSAIA